MARATLPALLSEPALVLPVVQGAPERLAGEGASVLAVVQQHLAIDNHIKALQNCSCDRTSSGGERAPRISLSLNF